MKDDFDVRAYIDGALMAALKAKLIAADREIEEEIINGTGETDYIIGILAATEETTQ